MKTNLIAGILTIVMTLIILVIEKSTIGILIATFGFVASVILTIYNLYKFREKRKK